MLNENKQQETTTPLANQQSFGGHELLDAHEAIGTLIGTLDHFVVYSSYVQDQELTSILNRQKEFLTQMYNTIVNTLTSGQVPNIKTQVYEMVENHHSTYGMSQSAPKSPIQTPNELNDECISSAILGHLKAISTGFTTTALEATNPILRRIFADSIPNTIEMAYEVYLYQNKHQYYQVPQLPVQDMQMIRNSFAPVQTGLSH